MKDRDKTRAELLEELRELRLRFAALDSTQRDDDQTTTPNAIEHRTAILKKGHALARLGIYELVAPFEAKDVSWSQEMFRITGRSPALGAPAVQEYFDEIVHPEDQPRLKQAWELLSKKDGKFDLRYRVVRPEGSVRYIHSVGEVNCHANGELLKVIGTIIDRTEQEEAERKLQRMNQLFNSILENASLCVSRIDENGVVTESRGRALEKLGLKENELVGFNYLDPSSPHHAEVKRALAGEALKVTHRAVHEGKPLCFQNYLFPDKVTGKGLVNFSVDVTELTEAQEELKVQSRVLDSMGEGVNVSDENGNILYTNPAFDAMFGYSQGELTGAHTSLLNANPSDENDRLRGDIVESLKTKGVWSGEFSNRKKDGTLFFTSANISSLGISGKTCSISVQEDITERKQIEDALRLVVAGTSHGFGQDFILSLVRQLAAALRVRFAFVTELCEGREDRVRTLALWNGTGFSDNFEYDTQDTPCAEVVAKEITHFPERVQELFPKDTLLQEMGIESYLAIPLFDEAGKPLGHLGVMHDRPMEEATLATSILSVFASRAGAELERKRAEAALEKSHEQLRQAQKMEAIGKLAGGIAHDFNNLLTVINGYCEILLEELPSHFSHRQEIKGIHRAGDRAVLLTRQLLAFSRKQILKLETLNANEVVAELVVMLERIISENIEMRFHRNPQPLMVKADFGQVEQALLNIVINAQDAMTEGGQLTIQTSLVPAGSIQQTDLSVSKSTDYVEISVRDTGEGMKEETKRRLFEPFYTTKDVGKATGLGLAVVYGIIRQHDGYIVVESEPGKGTEIKLYFPVAEEIRIPQTRSDDAIHQQSRGETVLLIEDDDSVREIGVRMLAGFGYQVLTASDGVEAVEIFEREREHIDLVLMDVVMPRMSGPETYKQMREFKANLPAIFVTGHDLNSEIHKLDEYAEGSSIRVLRKPYSKTRLGQEISKLLGR